MEQLSTLRKIILEKRETINKIHTGASAKKIDVDNVLSEISCMVLKFKTLAEIFQSKNSHYIIVMNPDALSLSESKSIKEHLQNLGIKLESLIVNKYQGGEKKLKRAVSSFPEIPVTTLVEKREEIIGFDKLNEFPELFTV